MDAADIGRIAERADHRFRLEALPVYEVAQEVEDLAAWRRGDWTLPTPETSGWLRYIADTTADGVQWVRVRILDYPLSEYSEYELCGYQANVAAGEDVYVADRAWHRDLHDVHQDFWVFDQTVVVMHYDDAGHFARAELAADTRPYRGMRALALRNSIPLHDYLARHEPRLIA